MSEKSQSAAKNFGIQTILNEGETGLAKVLSLKADKNDLEKIHEIKTNKEDTENMMDLIVEMNQQIQHTVVLLNETLRLNLQKPSDTKLSKENRLHELLTQV